MARKRPDGTIDIARAARQKRIAASVAAGKTVQQAAKDERVSRATASAAVNSPEGQMLVTTLVEAERVQIRTVFNRAIAVIAEAMEANKIQASEGVSVDCGADHYARLTAVKCLTGLLTAGRQPVKPEPQRRTITMDELRDIMRAREQDTPKAG